MMMKKRWLFAITVLLFIAAVPTASADSGWWNDSWQYRGMVTIDHTKVDSDLENFTVLVKIDSISDLNFSKVAGSSGEDIRFVASDGSTELKYEIERWDDSNNLAEIWVKIPTVSNSADTVFYMYYGNSGASDGQDAEDVWDDNFKMVQHLDETSKTAGTYNDHLDSTSNNNDAEAEMEEAHMDTTGRIDGADEFDGSNDYVNCGNDNSLNITGTAITVESWVSWDSADDWSAAVMKTTSSGWINGYGLYAHSTNYIYFWVTHFSSNRASKSFTADSQWHYVVGTYDGSNVSIWVDGVEGTSDNYTGSISEADRQLEIGRGYGNSYNFNGKLDEVRISNSARSAAWIKTSYCSGKDSLLSFGAGEEKPCTGCQRWYLSSTGGSYVMYKGDKTQTAGTVTVGDDGEQIWLADETATCNLSFPADTWTGRITFDAGSNDTTVRVWVGTWNGSQFTPSAAGENATINGSGDFSTSSSEFNVSNGEWLAFRIQDYDADGNSSVVSVGLSSSYLTSGATDPAYPIPELPAMILFSVGVLVLAGYAGYRRKEEN